MLGCLSVDVYVPKPKLLHRHNTLVWSGKKHFLIKLENSWNSTPFRNLEHFIILWYLRIVNVYVFWCVLNIGQGYSATVVC